MSEAYIFESGFNCHHGYHLQEVVGYRLSFLVECNKQWLEYEDWKLPLRLEPQYYDT